MGSQWAARPWWAAWPVCLVRAAAPTGSWSQGSGRDRGWVSNQQKDGEEQEERGDLAPAPAASPCSVARVCREGQTQWLPLDCGLQRLLWFNFCHLLCVLQQDA